MTSNLEKIDLLRARIGVNYKEAKIALEKADGDVVQALINLEEESANISEKVHQKGSEMAGRMCHWVEKGHKTVLKFKKGDQEVMEIPISLGIAGLVGTLFSTELAIIGAVGAIAAMHNNYKLEVSHKDDQAESKIEDN